MPKLSNVEIAILETNLGFALPALYRKLLHEIGFGVVGAAAVIYNPSCVRGLFEPFFDDPTQLFKPYFPFGCDNHKQELWVIDASTERAASIWHETVPEDWPEEEWLPYAVWEEQHLGSLPGGHV